MRFWSYELLKQFKINEVLQSYELLKQFKMNEVLRSYELSTVVSYFVSS
jgi:hypothetical protein